MPTTIEFYKVSFIKSDPENPMVIEDYFTALINRNVSFKGDYDRDLYKVTLVKNKYYGGMFRKFRTDEIIETGKVGIAPKKINYPKGEGKLEGNPLMFFPEFNIIAYIRNRHGNHYKRLESCLSSAFKREITLSPLVKQGSLKNILNNKEVVQLDFSVPISAKHLTNNGQLWSDNAIQAVAQSGANILKIQANIDLRKKNHGKIKNAYENIKNLLSNNATRAVVKIEDIDGAHDTIDLITDRILYVDSTYTYAKEALTSRQLYDKIETAYLGKYDEIKQVC